MTFVQVFLKGEKTAEISGELVSVEILAEGVRVKHLEGEDETEHFIPHCNLNMVRSWDEKNSEI